MAVIVEMFKIHSEIVVYPQEMVTSISASMVTMHHDAHHCCVVTDVFSCLC